MSTNTYPSLTIKNGEIVKMEQNSISVETGGTILLIETKNGIVGGPIGGEISQGTIDVEDSPIAGIYNQPECGISRELKIRAKADGRVDYVEIGNIIKPADFKVVKGNFPITNPLISGDCKISWVKVANILFMDIKGTVYPNGIIERFVINTPSELTFNKPQKITIPATLVTAVSQYAIYFELEFTLSKTLIFSLIQLDPVTTANSIFPSDYILFDSNFNLI